MDNFGTTDKTFSAFNLKILALLFMVIDHVAAIVRFHFPNVTDANEYTQLAYRMFRILGRLSFPLYVVLLVEGFFYTRSRKKYMLRMFIFAFISEIPFDIAFELSYDDVKKGRIIEFGYQNVFFTLLIGLGTLTLIDYVRVKRYNQIKSAIIVIIIVAAAGILAGFVQCDYGFCGVIAIVFGYFLRHDRKKQVWGICLALIVASVSEVFGLFILPIVERYNGSKGRKMGLVFYLVYPLHLILLSFLCWLVF